MSETVQQVSTGIRVMLRRPSEQQLPEDDIRARLMDLLRGYCRDLSISPRDRQTVKDEVQVVSDGDNQDYLLTVPTDSDFEAVRLEYEICEAGQQATFEARLIPYSAWPRHYGGDEIVATIYGQDNERVAVNLTCSEVESARWFLSYRPTLLGYLQSKALTPLPSDFIPMIKTEGAILCAPLVNNDSDEWVKWIERWMPLYKADALRWNNPDEPMRPGRWQHYLTTSVEPQVQPIHRSDRHRNRSQRIRPFVPAE